MAESLTSPPSALPAAVKWGLPQADARIRKPLGLEGVALSGERLQCLPSCGDCRQSVLAGQPAAGPSSGPRDPGHSFSGLAWPLGLPAL